MELDCPDEVVLSRETDSVDESMIPETINSDMEEDCDEENDSDDDADENELRQLESVLSDNPYDYSAHTALINKLQTMGELDKLRLAREDMSSKYPLSPELWLNWLKDEMKLAVTDEDRSQVINLCERAIKDYLSVEVWLEYLQFSIGSMSNVESASANIRSLFERALTSVGLHVTKGAIVWEAFREFENVLVSLMPDEVQKKQQIDRVGNLFRRQLACPLLNMDKTFDEYKVWRSDQGKSFSISEQIITDNYQRALAQLNARLVYEDKINSNQNETQLLETYKEYLKYEKQNGDPGRTTVLYERAVTDLSLQPQIWEDYLSYVESTIKSETILMSIYERAVRNVSWYSKIWQKWMRSMEKWNKPLLQVQKLLENALLAGFSTADDYRIIWMSFLEYLRRILDTCDGEERKKHLEIIRQAFNRACEHLAKSFGLVGDPQCTILQFWARTEAIHANDMEKTRSLWTDILSQGHSTVAASWLEYINIERCYGDTKHLRKLYQRALVAVKDWPESIVNAWIEFERDEGTLEQMEACESKTKEVMAKVLEEREKNQKQVHQQDVKRGTKRKPEEGGKWQKLGPTSSKQSKIEKEIGGDVEMKSDKSSDVVESESFQQVDEKITVFVSNLDYTATEEQVREALAPAGPITLFRTVKDFKGRSKGFCYVQLSSPAAVNEALKLDRTPINGRPMYVSRCDPDKTTRGTAFKYACSLEKNKLFIKGLPLTTTKEDLENLYKTYGALKDVRLVTYRNGHSKGLAYVEFKNKEDAAKALLATDGMTLGDKVISVAISQPPERKKGTEDELIKSLGGSSTSRTHFGLPKTMLSMVPRSVKTIANNGNSQADNVKPMNNQDFRNMFMNKK